MSAQDVYEVSSGEEEPHESDEEVISINDDEPKEQSQNKYIQGTQVAPDRTTTKKIAITIEDSVPRTNSPKSSTKITISIEDSDIESSSATSNTPTTKHTLPAEKEPRKSKIRKVESGSQPRNEMHGENNPVCDSQYQEFINLCSRLDPSSDMRQVIERKIRRYYGRADRSYLQSKEFKDMLVHKTSLLRSDPCNIWRNIKDVVDELKLRKKPSESESMNLEPRDPEVRERARGLELRMRSLQHTIQRLEEQEVDLDKENDSVYLTTESYKEKLVRVYAELCALTGARASSHSRVRFARREGRPRGPAARLEAWVNRPQPHGRPPPFPDFHDVLQCVRAANAEDRLMWTESQVMEEARELFTRCGRALQQRRQRRDWRLTSSRLGDAADPAESSPELQATLARNRLVARHREALIFDKYAQADREMMLSYSEHDSSGDEQPAPSERPIAIELGNKLQVKNTKCDDRPSGREQKETTLSTESIGHKMKDSLAEAERTLPVVGESTPLRAETPASVSVNKGTIGSYRVIVSDGDDCGSDVDELKLLRKTNEVFVLSDESESSEMRALREIERSGADYSTGVFGIESDTDYEHVNLSDVSEGSDCVLVQSDESSDDAATDEDDERHT